MLRFLGKRLALIGLDVLLLGAAYAGAYYLRDAEGFVPRLELILLTLPLFLILTIPVFIKLGLYHAFLRFAGVSTAVTIVKGVTIANLLFLAACFLLFRSEQIPRGVLVINWMADVLLIGGTRLSVRTFLQYRRGRGGRRVLLHGRVEDAEGFLRDLAQGKLQGYSPVGLVDPDPTRAGRYIHGIRVHGGDPALPAAVKSLGAEEILFVGHVPPRAAIHQLLDDPAFSHVRFKVVPPVSSSLAPGPSIGEVRDVHVEDLLKRDPKDLNLAEIRQFIEGRSVLITGAGGSIGSELVFQVAANRPRSLILVEFSEEKLHQVRMQLERRFREVAFEDYLADVSDLVMMKQVFEKHRPDHVFHAAAYKHVNLVEENPCQGIVNNIEGLRVVAELAVQYEARTVVFISTDKAVRPVSLMGATKRLGERFIRELQRTHSCRLVAVRFGNVLGSSGSVVHVFHHQILAGGPVTVTDPTATRYFMLPSEAVQLVLQAASEGEGGKVYVLDMGDPVGIEQLARDMIRLMGHVPEKDIQILHTGLRPGEKLHEELVYPGYRTSTKSASIWEDTYQNPQAIPATSENLRTLVEYARAGETGEAIRFLEKLVPGFEPMYPETRGFLSAGSACFPDASDGPTEPPRGHSGNG